MEITGLPGGSRLMSVHFSILLLIGSHLQTPIDRQWWPGPLALWPWPWPGGREGHTPTSASVLLPPGPGWVSDLPPPCLPLPAGPVYPYHRFPGSDVSVPLPPGMLRPPKGSLKVAVVPADAQGCPAFAWPPLPQALSRAKLPSYFLRAAWVCLEKGRLRPLGRNTFPKGNSAAFRQADPVEALDRAWP